eukprot:m.116642 g.116642  ORF g.116642 m.116642 type:complete len:273 (+) comp17181_c0_seq19:1993-2811(+)
MIVLSSMRSRTFQGPHVDSMILGANSKDGTAMFYANVPPAWNATEKEYTEALHRSFGDRARSIAPLYPTAEYDHFASSAFYSAYSDYEVVCPTWQLADIITANNRTHTVVYTYFFTHGPRRHDLSNQADELVGLVPGVVPIVPPVYNQRPEGCAQWGAHATELDFIFNASVANDVTFNLNQTWPAPFDPSQRILRDAIMGYWGAFVRSGMPSANNPPKFPNWRPVKLNNSPGIDAMQLDTGDLLQMRTKVVCSCKLPVIRFTRNMRSNNAAQ